jgi:ATP-binding cassette subfamily F protein uup
MIEKFCFDNPYSLIGNLSGGEKRRLMLLALLMASPNVLLLDEPTNNLDIATMNIFESYLDDFQGSVIVASHDRYFLDKVCDRFFAFTDTGRLEPHLGSFSHFLASQKPNNEKETVSVSPRIKKQSVRKLTFKEQQEYSEIEDIISELEKRLESVTKDIEKNYENYAALKDLYEQKQTLEAELEAKISRWGFLTEIDECSKTKD